MADTTMEMTLRVLDGADRGRVFERLPTPVTIGREEGNAVQLNDERISRFHIKIQEDQGKLVLTDLESTNGTRVNGEDAQLRILRYGDVISLGRSVLLYGTREQIAGRLDALRDDGLHMTGEMDPSKFAQSGESSLDFEVRWGESENLHSTLHIPTPPELPEGLSPGQAAQLSETARIPPPAKPRAGPIGLARRGQQEGIARHQAVAGAVGFAGPAGRIFAEDRRSGGGVVDHQPE